MRLFKNLIGDVKNLLIMRLLLFNCFILLSSSILAETLQINNVRIWAAPDSTRVVFDVTGNVKHKLFTLKNPDRTVIDIQNTAFNKSVLAQPQSQDKYLRRLRVSKRNTSDVRVVLDLKQNVRYKSFQLSPNKHYGHRLVIDLYGVEQKSSKVIVAKSEPSPSRTQRDVIIALDAGHGGEDPGAVGPNGTHEKKVVFQISRYLEKIINKERGMRAVMVRKSDYHMSLRKRIDEARKHKADLFISIHADAFKDARVQGSSVYVLSKRGASSEAARWLAKAENASDLIGGVSLDDKDDMLASVLLDLSQTASLESSINVADRVLRELKRVGRVHKKTVQSAGFMVLKSPDIPSILVETAFISNPKEEEKLLSKKYRQNISHAILAGLRSYFKDYAPDGTLLSSRKHVITSGETLSLIAERYQVNADKLRRYNGLKGNMIRIGQTLNIPSREDT